MRHLFGLLLLAVLAGPVAAEGPAPRVLEGTGAAEADGVFPRRLRDEVGEVVIPAEPKRIVAIQTGQLDALLVLGLVPVGAGRGISDAVFADYHLTAFPDQAEAIRAVADVGSLQEPDLEAIAALRPDLILYTKAAYREGTYAALKAIAPVVTARGMGVNWKIDFLLVGHAVGRAGAAQAFLDRYHAEAAAVAGRWAGSEAPTVSFLTTTGGRLRLFGPNSFPGGIAADLGLARPAGQQFETAAEDVSGELVDRADADWIFYAGLGDDVSGITGLPLWPTLGAVAAGQAVPVEFKLFFNSGPTAAQLLGRLFAETIGDGTRPN